MQIGFFAVGIGPSANPELLALTARAVEQCGFHSLWTGEHVVLVSQYASKYPYTQDGRMPLPTTKVDFLDPFADRLRGRAIGAQNAIVGVLVPN